MKKIKNQNAITLIALVITIIVLLILAGVALSLVLGEEGIVGRTIKSRGVHEAKETEEKIRLAVSSAQVIGLGKVDETTLKQDLTDYFGTEGVDFKITGNQNTGYYVVVPKDNVAYYIPSDGGLEAQELEKTQTLTDSLIFALVDDLGTRTTIYLYNNAYKITEGNITITMPDNTNETIVAQADTSEIVYDENVKNYATYTVSKNGTYTFTASDGENESELSVKVENIEKFTSIETLASEQNLSYAGGKENAYTYKGAVVPKGYYVDEKSDVATGLVITDDVDEDGYSTGNEWVWVPVNSTVGNDDYYGEESSATSLAGATSVKYTKYSKLYSFVDKTREDYGTFHPFGNSNDLSRPSTTSSPAYREIAILTNNSQGEVGKYNLVNNRTTGTAFSNVTDVATQYRDDFDNMVASVDNYHGFYIGRYELTSSGEKPGNSLTNTTWYAFYNQCLTYGKDNTESGMIYGCLWDATMQWLAKSNYSVGYTGNTYSGYGNYKSEAVEVKNSTTTITVKSQGISQKLLTGQSSYTKSNNIFDLSGNYQDFTQEANTTGRRISRGGGSGCFDKVTVFAAVRGGNGVPAAGSYDGNTGRAQLWIK